MLLQGRIVGSPMLKIWNWIRKGYSNLGVLTKRILETCFGHKLLLGTVDQVVLD